MQFDPDMLLLLSCAICRHGGSSSFFSGGQIHAVKALQPAHRYHEQIRPYSAAFTSLYGEADYVLFATLTQ